MLAAYAIDLFRHIVAARYAYARALTRMMLLPPFIVYALIMHLFLWMPACCRYYATPLLSIDFDYCAIITIFTPPP